MKRPLLTMASLLTVIGMQGATPVSGIPEGGWAFPQVRMPGQKSQGAPADGDLLSLRQTAPASNARMAQWAKRLGDKNRILIGYNDYRYKDVPCGLYKLSTTGDFDFLYSSSYTDKRYRYHNGWMRKGNMCALYSYGTYGVEDFV